VDQADEFRRGDRIERSQGFQVGAADERLFACAGDDDCPKGSVCLYPFNCFYKIL